MIGPKHQQEPGILLAAFLLRPSFIASPSSLTSSSPPQLGPLVSASVNGQILIALRPEHTLRHTSWSLFRLGGICDFQMFCLLFPLHGQVVGELLTSARFFYPVSWLLGVSWWWWGMEFKHSKIIWEAFPLPNHCPVRCSVQHLLSYRAAQLIYDTLMTSFHSKDSVFHDCGMATSHCLSWLSLSSGDTIN